MLIMTTGVVLVIIILVIGELHAKLEHDVQVDDDIITLIKMSVTGLIGVIAGYMGRGEGNN